MKMKIIILGLCAELVSFNSWAGFSATTCHSRANCATFNESITWNYLEAHWWQVISTHTPRHGAPHVMDTGMHYTRRAAAVHVGEATDVKNNPWKVQGMHFYQACSTCKKVYDYYTESVDCSGYNGWWDKSG